MKEIKRRPEVSPDVCLRRELPGDSPATNSVMSDYAGPARRTKRLGEVTTARNADCPLEWNWLVR